MSEIRRASHEMKKGKAPGTTGMPIEVTEIYRFENLLSNAQVQ